MHITVHRGLNQIGGCLTEITTKKTRIFIDLGQNLPGSTDQPDEYDNPKRVRQLLKGCRAVFYTHAHQDHVGLSKYVPRSIKQYIGAGAKNMLLYKYSFFKVRKSWWQRCKERFSNLFSNKAKVYDYVQLYRRFRAYKATETIHVGDIAITPLSCSHSIFDSYMFLIEAEGKRVLHTGDFRQHGYLGGALKKMLKRYFTDIDFLIMEGTSLSPGLQHNIVHENSVCEAITRELKQHKYVFVLCSASDADRMASLQKAAESAGRFFLVDRYQSGLLQIYKHYLDWKDKLYDFRAETVDVNLENMDSKYREAGFCIPIRGSQKARLATWIAQCKAWGEDEPALIYSAWEGYIMPGQLFTIQSYVDIYNLFSEENRACISTSGHAALETLEKVCNKIHPKQGVMIIHKSADADINKLNIAADIKVVKTPEITL